MSSPRRSPTRLAKIALLSLCCVVAACNTLKRVNEGELLLTENTIYADGEKVLDADIRSLIIQEPNSRLLGYPLRLNLYNLAKKDADSAYRAWLLKKPKRLERLSSILSEKQVHRLGESFFVSGYSEWLKNIGEAPVIIDTSKAGKTLERLSSYYDSKGYFNNTTTYSIDSTAGNQRGAITYRLELKEPYTIDSLGHQIQSPAVDSIYSAHAPRSRVRVGKQFNLSDFTRERERLTNLFRNTGIYGFQESSITYDIKRDTTTNEDTGMKVTLNISNLNQRGDGTDEGLEYKVNKIKKVNIFADYNFEVDRSSLDTVQYKNYIIHFRDKLRYKPKALTDAIFLVQDSVYRNIDRLRTYRQISNLNTFKYPNIQFEQDSTRTELTANVFLAARPRYSLGMNLDVIHSNIQQLGVGLSTSLIARNIFRGAETLSLSARGTYGLLSDASLPEDYFTEFGGDINLTFPRIWFPFVNTRNIIQPYMLPQTRVNTGTSFQKNIGLDKQTLNAILGYTWTPSDAQRTNFELLNIQYVRNVNPERFFNVYTSSYRRLDDIADDFEDNPQLAEFYENETDPGDPRLRIPEGTTGFIDAVTEGNVDTSLEELREVSRIEERRLRLTENNLIFTSNYSFTKNNRENLRDDNFYQYRVKLESAGNLLAGISNFIPFEKTEDGNRLVFGVPFSQYAKAELDFVKYWPLAGSNVLAFHSFIGLAVPYGNSNSIPFVRSYFAGGSNDNRAWNPYSLGPGSTRSVNDFNEANFKLAMNLEFRFPLFGNLNGALFADAGNIWNVWDNVDDPDAVFSGLGSLQDIALGTGFGLRYDFTYFVFRVDYGFKTYNPAEEPSKRWFRDYNFANGELQIGINYPF